MNTIINRLEETVVGLLLVALTLLVFFEVVLRFGFGTGLIWAQEVSLYLGAWFILIGASYALREGAHIAVDAVVNLFDGPARRAVGALAIILSLGYCAILIGASWSYLGRLHRIGIEMEDVPLPRWLGQSCVLLGFLFLGMRLVALLVAVLRGQADGFRHVDEASEALEALAEHEAQSSKTSRERA